MTRRSTLSLWAIVLLAPAALASGAGGFQSPPGIQGPPGIPAPVGIGARGTVLPGQRQSAPVLGTPPVVPPMPPTSEPARVAPVPAIVEPPAVDKQTLPKPAEGTAPSDTAPPPAATAPAQLPAENPFEAYSKQLKSPNFVPPAGAFDPGMMGGPANLLPAPAPITPGFNLGKLHRGGCHGNTFPAGVPCLSGKCCTAESCGGGDCGSCAAGCAGGCGGDPYWFGAVGGLVMGRTAPNSVWISDQLSDPSNRLMSTANAAAPWTGGWEASVGRVVPGRGGMQFTYWGLAPMSAFDSVRLPGDLGTPIDFCELEIAGECAGDFFDDAQEHRIWRRDEINNLELNFFGAGAGPCNFTWLAGVRYFRFRDQLIWGAVQNGFEFGDNGGIDEAYLDIATANNLIGGQLGAWANCPLGERLGVFVFPRVGLFANAVNQRYRLYRGDGVYSFDYFSNKTVGALIAQLDVGISYVITPRWSTYLGYRVLAASGVGLADNQIPATMIDSPSLAAISTNGNLILQGATAGLIFQF